MLKSINLVSRLRFFAQIRLLCTAHDSLGQMHYNREETSKILAVINKSSLNDFKNYQISHQRIQRIIKQRESKGNFEQVESLLEIDGFGIKVLEKFCNSIINKPIDLPKPMEAPIAAKRQVFVTPAMLETVRTRITSVVSFHVDLKYFAWTKFHYERSANADTDEPKFFIHDWNCLELAKQDKLPRLTDLLELVVKLTDHIPQADVYAIEALPPAVQAKQPGSALQVNVNIQKAQLVAMLCALMAARRSASKLFTESDSIDGQQLSYIESVYFLRNFLPSRFYKILIGNERVSVANVVNEIIAYNYTMHSRNEPTFAAVSISREFQDFWRESERIHQEYLGNSMLVGLTFLKLCVERCAGSLDSLNGRAKKG